MGRSLLWDGSLSSPFTAHSSESFSVQGRDGGEVSDKEFLEVFFCVFKINRRWSKEGGMWKVVVVGGRVDF